MRAINPVIVTNGLGQPWLTLDDDPGPSALLGSLLSSLCSTARPLVSSVQFIVISHVLKMHGCLFALR